MRNCSGNKTKIKMINIFMKSGAKKTSEKIWEKSFKTLLKNSPKQTNELVKLVISLASPTFKVHTFPSGHKKKRNRRNREVLSFITNKSIRTSLALKFVKQSLQAKVESSAIKLSKEILASAKNGGQPASRKTQLHKYIAAQTFRTHKFFRWN